MSILAEILAKKLIPWTQHNAGERFIVAGTKMNAAEMPSGVQLFRRKTSGKRVVVKSQRQYENTRGIVARWPEAHLNEVNKLKLVCVLDGNIDFQLGNFSVRCGAGHFFFVPPGMPHPDGHYQYVDKDKSIFCDILLFLLHPHALQCWINSSRPGIEKEKKSYLFTNEHVTKLFQILVEETINDRDLAFHNGGHLLAVFFSILLREVVEGRVQSIFSEDANVSIHETQLLAAAGDFAATLHHYVQANLHKTLPLEIVARDMFLSQAQFTRIVRRETGKSFNEFLIFHRMEKARELLQNSDWTVAAISTFVGFKSPSYFNKIFKQYIGQTPMQYRALRAKQGNLKN